MSKKVVGLILLLGVANSLVCSDKGYEEYLKEYSFKRGLSVDYVKFDVKVYYYYYFMDSCYKLSHKIQNGGIGEVTSLLDWNGDELEELGTLSVTYSGVSSSYEVIGVKEKEYSIQMTSRDFPYLADYNSPEKKCATSWVTATIELAEMALDHKVRLSARQLFDCLPKDEGIDGCEGVNMKTLSHYLSETGLVTENDFKDCESIDPLYTYHINSISPEVPTGSGLMNLMFDEKKPAMVLVALNLDKLRFVKDMSNMDEGYKCGGYQPSVYGLLTGYKYSGDEDSWWEIRSRVVPGEEIVLKLPMSLNMTNANYGGIAAYAFVLRSDTSTTVPTERMTDVPTVTPTERMTEVPTTIPTERMTEAPTTIPTERMTDVPTTIPTERMTDVPTTIPTEEMTEAPTTIPTERMTEAPTTIPTERMTEAPTVIPTERVTESPTTIPTEKMTEVPTTIPICKGNLTVSSNNDCSKLFDNYWSSITVNEGYCNSITRSLTIESNPCLTSIVVKKNSLKNLNSLRIANAFALTNIVIEDGDGGSIVSSSNTGAFYYVKSVTITSSMIYD